MSYTLADLTEYCQRHGWRGAATADSTQLKAWINDTIQRLVSMRNWPSYRKPFYIGLTAPYTTGTVALTNGSATVVGTTTAWTSAMVGQEFYTGTDGDRVYQITAVGGTGSLTLAQPYLGTAGTLKTYQINYVRYGMATDFDRPYGGLYDQFGREIRSAEVPYDEWAALRMQNRGTMSLPTHMAFDKGGPGQSHTTSIYFHPAPSTTHMLRGTYQASPVLATDIVAPDWPERFRYLLHEALRIELTTQDGKGQNPVSISNFENMVEQAYRRDVQKVMPVTIRVGGRRDVFDELAEFRSQYTIL